MYFQLTISAPTESEARKISDELLTQQLIAGCMVTSGNTYYWWEGKVAERLYLNINAYTLDTHKEKIISTVKKLSSDETPVIAFAPIDGSPDFLNWISKNASGAGRGI